MDQALALEIMEEGLSVLLTGPAGSGKTYVLNEFIRRAKKQHKTVAVTATTGLAATHLGGNTIHSWSGIGVMEELPKKFFEGLTKSKVDNLTKSDVLIIDEISMLHDYRLDMIDNLLRQARKNDIPFGGIQLILCGDFFQLPPVNRSDAREGSFVVNSSSWRDLGPVICYLDEQHRQDDTLFLDVLNAIRNNDIRRRHVTALQGRKNKQLGSSAAVTELHTTNVDVDSLNARQLSGLKGSEHIYNMQSTGKEYHKETLKRSCLAQENLVLKKGALVICIKNNTEKKFVNGSLGVVVDFDKNSDYPIVKLNNGRKVTILPDTWELRDGDKKRASLTQLPLRLAWAITVHKSQGMTLDAARINLERAFVEGMGYVALSRVRSLDTLSLLGLNAMALRVSPEALEIDQHLRLQSDKASKKYEHLRERVKSRKTVVLKLDSPSTWSEKLASMRQKFPKAYTRWEKADDQELKERFVLGDGVAKLSQKFGRHPGSIKSRLIKHFGEDVEIPK
ncbi:MAG TPA: PIF1 family DEAD/DEAH box helicase [Candidatus Saccharibacteria bacterium]|nr:PIF1 family DEAD/DEAH box helicase [Candidatus Saccharibacteria bacterium]